MNQYPDFDQKLYDDLRRGKEYAFAAVFERYNRLLPVGGINLVHT